MQGMSVSTRVTQESSRRGEIPTRVSFLAVILGSVALGAAEGSVMFATLVVLSVLASHFFTLRWRMVALPRWLAEPPLGAWVMAFASATPADGGTGATYVLLRRGVVRSAG